MRKLAFAVDACRTLCWCKKVRGEAPLFTVAPVEIFKARRLRRAMFRLNPLHAGARGKHRRLLEGLGGFVTAAEGMERSHARYTTSTTCNLHSLLDCFFSTLDTCLKETCSACSGRGEAQASLLKASSSPSQLAQASSLQASSVNWLELASSVNWLELNWLGVSWARDGSHIAK